MDRLSDMLHFPTLVNAGATLNVIVTITVTYFVEPPYPQPLAPLVWIALVLALNLLPVLLLRQTMKPGDPVRTLRSMDFVHDQHKFSDWVYLAASANMAFWILSAWTLFATVHTPTTLAALLAVAFLATFSPVLARTAGLLRH
jgi:hypothetical protein